MQYSIGQVSEKTGLPISTLYYYDRKGLFPELKRNSSGSRIFTEREVKEVRQIECLKYMGFSIGEIKQYLTWQREGSITLQQRRDMFDRRMDAVKEDMDRLERILEILQLKHRYCDEAMTSGSLKDPQPSELSSELYEMIKPFCE